MTLQERESQLYADGVYIIWETCGTDKNGDCLQVRCLQDLKGKQYKVTRRREINPTNGAVIWPILDIIETK